MKYLNHSTFKILFRIFVASFLLNAFINGNGFSQPINGCYLGAYLGCGTSDLSCITPQQFNAQTGKSHYCFSRYINANDNTDLLNSSHWLWADSLMAIGARPVFFLMPFGTLTDYSNTNRDAALSQFAQSCAAFQQTVYIVFGHEMNGNWYPWGNDSTNYKLAFQHVKSLMAGIATNVKFCWIPIQAWGQGNYSPYYPGDSYVDWVGLNVYDRDYNEDNHVYENELDSAISYLHFYHDFSALKNKPMMIGETALFDANWDPTVAGQMVPLTSTQLCTEKNEWISALYNKDTLHARYPNLNMIIYFNVEKSESGFASQNHNFGTITVDWRIPLQSGCDTYSGLISDSYFLGATPLGISENDSTKFKNGAWIKAYPNPVSDMLQLEYYLPEKSSIFLYLINSSGKIVDTLFNGLSESGTKKIEVSVKSISSGSYQLVLETANHKKTQQQISILKTH